MAYSNMASLRSLYTQLFPPKPTFTEEHVPSQQGKVFIVTGGNSGVGFELCKILYGTGATVYMASRSEERATDAIKQITQSASSPGTLNFLPLDLNDLASVRSAAARFAAQEPKLDVLWNNAGSGPYRIDAQAKTVQGLEALVGMHCVATLLFTKLLEPQLRAAVDATSIPASVRVVWTSSISDQDSPRNGIEFDLLDTGTKDRIRNYSVSKVGSWMLGREMSRRWAKTGIVSVAINPGNVKAGSYEGMPGYIMLLMNRLLHETKFGAYTELYAGLSPDVTPEHNGAYIMPWGRIRSDSAAPRQDIIKAMRPEEEGGLGYCKKFWDWCEEKSV